MGIFTGRLLLENSVEESDKFLDFSTLNFTELESRHIFKEEVLSEGFLTRDPKIPDNIKITSDDIISVSKFKSKSKALLLWMEKNGYSEKKISSSVKMWYFAIIGTTFANGINDTKKYQPKMVYMCQLVEDYCVDKHKASVKKDLQQTIDALEKAKDKKELTQLQSDYYNDIKKAIKEIHI